MKEQYNTPTNTYIEFRFENSLRKYQKPPSKKVKCEIGKSNNCVKKNRQVWKGERLSRIASTVRINPNSNEKYKDNSRQISPLGLQNVSDFNMGTGSLGKARVRENQQENAIKGNIQLSDFQQLTPLRKKKTREALSQNQGLRENYPFSPKQNNSCQQNSVENRCSKNILFSSNQNKSQDNSNKFNQNQGQSIKIEETKNFRDIVGYQVAIEYQESQIIGNADLRTEQKKNVINHLESILRDKESPLAEYIFQMFDEKQYLSKKIIPKREKQREDGLDTPFSKINMGLSVSKRKQLRGQIFFQLQGCQTRKYETSLFAKHNQIYLDREKEQQKQVPQLQIKQDQQKKEVILPKIELQQREPQKYSAMQAQQKMCEDLPENFEQQKIHQQQCKRQLINQAYQPVQIQKLNQNQNNLQKYQKPQIVFHKASRKRKRDSCLQEKTERKTKQSHLKIRTGPIQCLLSLRVFNKFIRPYEDIDSIVDAILKNRPYLSSGKQDLIQAIKIYLNNKKSMVHDTLI